MKKWSLLITLLFVVCTQQPQDVVVKVNGSYLTKSDFESYIPADNIRQLPDARLKEFCENWVDQEVLYLEAKKLKIDAEDSIRLVIDEYRKNLLAMDLVRRKFAGTSVEAVEVRDYFNKHEAEFLYAVKLGQIVLASQEAADMTLEEIKAGADFYKLARERSLTRLENPDDPKVITDYLPRGTIADFSIEEKIFKMDRGELSEVIPYLQGTFLIVKMIDKKKIKAKADFSQYSGAIYNYLLSNKYQAFVEEYVDSLKQQYTVDIDLSVLKE